MYCFVDMPNHCEFRVYCIFSLLVLSPISLLSVCEGFHDLWDRCRAMDSVRKKSLFPLMMILFRLFSDWFGIQRGFFGFPLCVVLLMQISLLILEA